MRSKINKMPANLILFILITFVIMGLFGIGMSMEMKDGQMSDCPFTANTTSMCQMSAVEHVGQWLKAMAGKLTLLLLSGLLIFLVKTLSPDRQRELSSRIRLYCRTITAKIFAPLLLALSDGLIHPKIYPPKIIN